MTTTTARAGRTIDQAEFRLAMSHFATGLTVVAGLDRNGEPAGLTCQSFTSVSTDPQLVLICVGRGSTSWQRIEQTGHFTVSILAREQQHVSAVLGSGRADKFRQVPWHPSDHGTVRIDGALATIDARISAVHEAGDHNVVIGEVLDLSVSEDRTPLLYFRSAYGVA